MVSVRPAGGGAPHLGLGLYIVRLIVEFHGGEVELANRAGGNGVVASVELPESQ
jgi:signal transduction histidine kinase